MGVRKNYRNLTDVERARFVHALYHVKEDGLVDQFAKIHERHFGMNIHRSSHFLPWHREMVARFEGALQEHHPDVTIPYWDSTVDRSPTDPLWEDGFLGQFNAAWGLSRALGSSNLPTRQDVENNQGRDTYDAFWPELESDIHNPPHRWVGGEMSRATSPNDPVFYLHHCWIDMLWARWQAAHPGAPFVSSAVGAGLDDPFMEWTDRTPADVLDHRALHYTYEPNARFMAQQGPPRPMLPEQHQTVSVTMKNVGTDTWTPGGATPYRLGSQNPQDNETWGFGRIDVPHPVDPGSEVTFTREIRAPSNFGVYNYQWRMLQETIQWFGDFTPLTVIRVEPARCAEIRGTIAQVDMQIQDLWDEFQDAPPNRKTEIRAEVAELERGIAKIRAEYTRLGCPP
jgi:tyrosinase